MQRDPNAVAVAQRVRHALADAGVSAAEAARRLGWTQQYMARRMTGSVPFSGADLVYVAAALHIDTTQLLPERAA